MNRSLEPASPDVRSRPLAATLLMLGCLAALAAGLVWSVSVGAATIDLKTVWAAVFTPNPELTAHQIIQEVRLPRVLSGAMVGASFAVAGAIMQGMTRNPLADPSILGLNAGASLFLVLTFVLRPGTGYTELILISFCGAGFGAALVYGVGSLARGGLTPVKLALAGAAVAALLASLTSGLIITFNLAQDVLFYTAGGLQGTRWEQVRLMLPWFGAAMVGGLALSRSVTLLSLGEDVAKGLGLRTGLVRALCTVVVLLLAGASVAVAGGVGFVGLVVPHVARALVGLDYRLILPSSALLGALLLVLADLGARMVNPPFETPVGLLTALVGVPFFLYLARRDKRGM
ncbi:FecCD family ABC transporter permease [Truepera radiovictrix]|uniref:Transport system permease protein n=1 Tax=Truepera radiovictrix (strain DSM 17093 / CIP 108686 / LMG 22925 / RQ-24) TaxID=649638 RepID=D7CW14_TRURR|nr:iron ABC transporter permease [Truepera radiovictrix]ADI14277.1 transport system permease protein [Truepera radiovictrix DSM 17093]WMT57166.1 iron ABC transporter permease [Truepera radiovictrix]